MNLQQDPPSDSAALRAHIDASLARPILAFFLSAVFWLLLGSTLAIISSIKLHTPSFLTSFEWLTFGRVRPAHLNTVIYGWASMAGIGIMIWLQARLSRVPLPSWGNTILTASAVSWNLVMAAGTAAILAGYGTSVEWLEFPLPVAFGLATCFVPIWIVSIYLFNHRRVEHVYVSQWYLMAATFWFPILYIVGNIVIHTGLTHGVALSTANWWYAHNALGLWFTPIGLASAYFFIPKVLGRPVHSYYLSILGFWSLALAYNWAGTHHLLGGPLPMWLQAVGTVASMLMFVPVLTVGLNQHLTMRGNFYRLRESPTLRFIVFGAISYTITSIQGSLTALRTVNHVTHFTHYTIAHAHLGMYAFVTMVYFGAMYYMMPRLTGKEWPSASLIRVHFWASSIGMTLYFVLLSIGGIEQGILLNTPQVPFLQIVAKTIPYLWSRSFAGTLMTIGHVVFAISIVRMLATKGEPHAGPTLLVSSKEVQP
jgi:cytochrome c oxidase cbb3-type subunit I